MDKVKNELDKIKEELEKNRAIIILNDLKALTLNIKSLPPNTLFIQDSSENFNKSKKALELAGLLFNEAEGLNEEVEE